VIERAYAALSHWWRLLAESSPGGRSFERDGVLAAVVPAAPERSVLNSVVYESADGLIGSYDEVAAVYAEIGASWTVWVPPGDDAAAGFLASRGHLLDAEPMAMARDLSDVERPTDDTLREWTATGDIADVGPLNDRAYGYTDSFTRAFEGFPAGVAHVYVACNEGQPVACLLMTDHDGNSDLGMVAVVPEARGQGITRKLLGHALADAAERGNRTSTLVATTLGYPVYERAGYRPLEPFSMWELARSS
jgi:GNAT superfamily N-acetyltransferase